MSPCRWRLVQFPHLPQGGSGTSGQHSAQLNIKGILSGSFSAATNYKAFCFKAYSKYIHLKKKGLVNLQSQPKGLTWKPFSFRIGFATPVANKCCVWWVVLRGCNGSWSASDSIYVSISSSWEPTSTWNHRYQLRSLSTLSAAVQWSISSITKSYSLFGEKHHLWRDFVRSSYTGSSARWESTS